MPGSWSWIELGDLQQFEALTALELEIYPADDCITADEYLAYKASGNRVFVGSLDETWIGNYQISIVPADCPLSIAGSYISGLAVFKPHQGRGYSRVLMDRLLSVHGACDLVARVRETNCAPLRLAQSRGFDMVKRQIRNGVGWNWLYRHGRPLASGGD